MTTQQDVLWLTEENLAEDAARILNFLETRGTFRFPTLGTGLFSAAAGTGGDFDLTGYRSVWVRDNIHIAHAHLVWGEAKQAETAISSLFTYFRKYRFRFTDAIEGRYDPENAMLRPHIRFDGDTLEELPEKWSHAQNDALGAFLWLASRLIQRRDPAVPTPEEWDLLVELVTYLKTIEYWNDEDSGHWEEVRKVAASSIGVVVAGLRAFRQLMFPAQGESSAAAFRQTARPLSLNDVNEAMERGEQALEQILPSECRQPDPAQRRNYDAALLFLIYPYRALDQSMADKVVSNVTTHLMGDHGIRRYNGDSYWCADYREKLAADQRTVDFSDNLSDRDKLLEPGLEAQWCLFDPIVSIHYGLRFAEQGETEDRRRQIHHLQRSLSQLTRPESRFPAFRCPESYFCEKGRYIPNDICPLLWTQANLKLALHLAAGNPVT